MNKQKAIGLALMVPFLALVVYMVLSLKMWIIAVSFLASGLLALFGFHIFKGMSPKDAAKEVVNDIKKVEEKKVEAPKS